MLVYIKDMLLNLSYSEECPKCGANATGRVSGAWIEYTCKKCSTRWETPYAPAFDD